MEYLKKLKRVQHKVDYADIHINYLMPRKVLWGVKSEKFCKINIYEEITRHNKRFLTLKYAEKNHTL